jgi:hypothetical protein
MKYAFLLPAVVSLFLLSANTSCSKKNTGKIHRARLEIAGICMNYTISVLDSGFDTSSIVKDWTDDNTQITYHNVFRLGNVCDFPADIKQGEEFSFRLEASKNNQCAVCLAYYPTPAKSLSIKVIK